MANPIHISLDLETLSTQPNAAIVQIGAVSVETGNTFNEYISPGNVESAGFDVSVETLQWWSQQDPAVRKRVMSGTLPIMTVLSNFLAWCQEQGPLEDIHLWAWGADFDLPILRNAYEWFSDYPFNYRNHRCLRTAAAMAGLKPHKALTPHDALSDATAQAKTLLQVLSWGTHAS